MDDQTLEIILHIKQRLGGVDYEDIIKEFDWLMINYESRLKRIDKLERRLQKYEQVHISNPTQEEVEEKGLFYWINLEDSE